MSFKKILHVAAPRCPKHVVYVQLFMDIFRTKFYAQKMTGISYNIHMKLTFTQSCLVTTL